MLERPAPAAGAGTASLARVVAVLGGVNLVYWGTFFYLVTVLGPAIRQETGWSTGAIAAGVSIALLTSAAAAPFVGRGVDLLGGRIIIAAGAAIQAAGFLLLASAHSLPVYWASWIVIGCGLSGGLYEPMFATITQLFGRNARRGMTGITLIGGFAGTAGIPAGLFLLDVFGWRGAVVAFATVQACLSVPACLLFVPGTRQAADSRPAPSAAAGTGAPAPRPGTLFWITLGVASFTGVSSALTTNLLVFLEALGFTAAAAVTIGVLYGPAQVAARLGEMALQRRFDSLTVGRWASAGLSVALLLVLGSGAGAILFGIAFGVLFGASNGTMTVVRGAVPLLLYGPAGYGARQGRIARMSLIAQAIGPVLFAWLLDNAGARGAAMAAASVALLSPLAFLMLRRPR